MWFKIPTFGSKIHCHIIAITINGVMKGKKYAVLKNSEALIFEFSIQAKIKGMITPKIDVEKA